MSKNNQLILKVILFYIIIIFISPISSSKIYPIQKFIIANNLNHSNISNINLEEYFYLSLNIKGVGVIFDNNSNINLIPNHLFIQIKKILDLYSPDSNAFIVKKENDYQELVIYYYLNENFTFNLIFEKIGITFPNDVLFYRPIGEFNKNFFIFLTKENQENIIFGKKLIELMKFEINGEDEFLINNYNFITYLED